ncbi:MAG: 3-hydroxyacyl-ACP dehydratase [Cytophagaceae bacterium]
MTQFEPIVDQEILVQLIPQKEPFVMVDKLLSSEEVKTVSGLSITDKNIFCINGVFTEPGIVENIAQTAALRIGYVIYEKTQRGEALEGNAPIGFIGGIKDLKIYSLPKINQEIKTEIVFEKEVMDVSLIRGKVHCQGELIAECEMKIFVKKD